MNRYWRLELEGIDFQKLNDADREHIAKLIIEGYIEGEIMHE